jgi:hypothetical protein
MAEIENKLCKGLNEISGYLHPQYAKSFNEFGELRKLIRCGGWIIQRNIPATSYLDAMGCYPFFICHDWGRLHEDLNEMKSDLVSLVLVTDIFADVDKSYLEKHFSIIKIFKKHQISNLEDNFENYISKHHRYYAKRSLRKLKVEFCFEPIHCLEDWIKLYDNLSIRHKISGIRRFSKESFKMLLDVPGIFIVIGKIEGDVVGAHIIVIVGNYAYSHLAAFSDKGYRNFASYGIYWMTLEYLSHRKIKLFDLGGVSGIEDNSEDGLSRFKKGWSSGSMTNFLCGCIFDHRKYMEILRMRKISAENYFPAYRKGEFG